MDDKVRTTEVLYKGNKYKQCGNGSYVVLMFGSFIESGPTPRWQYAPIKDSQVPELVKKALRI